jgi:hypothetical protein
VECNTADQKRGDKIKRLDIRFARRYTIKKRGGRKCTA